MELSNLQKEYRSYFETILGFFDVDSPAKLTDDQKSVFFTAITTHWDNGKGPKSKDWKEKVKKFLVDKKAIKESNSIYKIERIKEKFGISESPVGARGRTSSTDAYEYIAENPEIVDEIEKLIRHVGGKTLFKHIIEIIYSGVDIDYSTLSVQDNLDKIKRRKIAKRLQGKFIED